MHTIKRLYSFGMVDGSYGLGTLEEIVEMEKESAIYSCSLATLDDLEWWKLSTGEMFEGQLIELKEGIYWLGNAA
ncbi:hypothetical protein [Clostridium sp. JNZ J1-5]